MTETNDRALPVGIQSFYEIREKGFLYVDKTDLIWELTHRGKKKYHYQSRPRRFGKSVLAIRSKLISKVKNVFLKVLKSWTWKRNGSNILSFALT